MALRIRVRVASLLWAVVLASLLISGLTPGQAAARAGVSPQQTGPTGTAIGAATGTSTSTVTGTATVTATVTATGTAAADTTGPPQITSTATLTAAAATLTTSATTPTGPIAAPTTLTAPALPPLPATASASTLLTPTAPLSATAVGAPASATPVSGTLATLNAAADMTAGVTATASAYSHLPLSFEPNQGQADAAAQFLSHGPGFTLYLHGTDATLVLTRLRLHRGRPWSHGPRGALATAEAEALTSTAPLSATVLRLHWLGANATPQLVGQDPLPGVANYFIGNDPSGWHTNVPTYARAAYQSVYPGVDLAFYGTQGRLEYDWLVAPGADPSTIQFSVEGAQGLHRDAQGSLILQTALGSVVQHAPVVYQEIGGQRHAIASGYVLRGTHQVGFSVGPYDTSQPLIIDPVLSYSTYLGGSGGDNAAAIAVDPTGAAYVTGLTSSTDFPTKNAFQGACSNSCLNSIAFVSKLTPGGSALAYSTYLGGNGGEAGYGIAVDSAGDAYVVGKTNSTNFPTQTPFQSACGNAGCTSSNAFVTKLTASGNGLIYSTYLGGAGPDGGYGIAVDGGGSAYVTGYTYSTNFPTHSPLQSACGNAGCSAGSAFVTKLTAGGSALAYSTYLGGNGGDQGNGIAVDKSGNAYVVGTTNSTNFPTKSPFQSACGDTGCTTSNVFVSKLNTSGGALVYSTYLGGNGVGSPFPGTLGDTGVGIAVDNAGNAYVTGQTYSTNFPTKNALQSACGDSSCTQGDGFVSAFTASGSALIYSTYLGGSALDQSNSIAVDSAGNAAVTGYTASPDFPTANALQSVCEASGCGTAFASAFTASGNALRYSTYLGGSAPDQGNGIAVDGAGNAYVTGNTNSTDFPTQNALQNACGNPGCTASNAFVAKLVAASSGSTPWHPHYGNGLGLGAGLNLSVDLSDGHVDLRSADLQIPGRGPDLTASRTWDSSLAQAGITGTAGAGWASSLTPSMSGSLTGTVWYRDAAATTWPFVYTGDLNASQPYTSYDTPSGLPWQLTASSAGYTLTNILTGETVTFTAQGQYRADTDAYGNSNSLSYGAKGAISEANSGGRTLALSYTSGGLLNDVQSPLWQSSGGTQGQHVTYGYNGSGQLTTRTQGAGTTDALTTTFGYSGTQLISVTTPYTQSARTWRLGYDGLGHVSSVTSPVSGTAGQAGYTPAYTTTLSYNPGQTVVVEGAGTSGALTTTYTLDSQGEPITVTDGLGHSRSASYDADHNVTRSTDANGNVTTNAYQYVGPNGSTGLITQTVQPKIQPYGFTGALEAITTTHFYDPVTHDLTGTLLPEGGQILYGYDAHHGVITTTQMTTTTTTWRGAVAQLDQYGEVTGAVDGRGLSVSSSGVAALTSQASPYTRHMGYDAQGDQTSSSTPPITTTLDGTTTASTPVTTTTGYDGDGNPTRTTSANGATTTTGYDHLGRPVTTTRPPLRLAMAPFGVPAASGVITTVAGTGVVGYTGDGGPAPAARLASGEATALNAAGDLFIADESSNVVREVNAGVGLITTVAGTGVGGYSGDGGPATAARLNTPTDVATDAAGNLFIVDQGNNRVREVLAATGVITTVAGTGSACSPAGAACGDGGAATSAQLNGPEGVALDAAGSLYIGDAGDNKVRKVTAGTGLITTVAGTGAACSPAGAACGDGGAATSAQLNHPHLLVVDGAGALYIADSADNKVRKVAAGTGLLTTVAGTGAAGFAGDGGAATSAPLNFPVGLALDGAANLYISDAGNNRVREALAATGVITTVAGTGAACSPAGAACGDGGAATSAQLTFPEGLSLDAAGDLLLGDDHNAKVRAVGAGAIVAPTQTTGYDGDGNIVQQTDANGAVSTSSYDPLGRLVSQTNPVSGTTVYTYNATEQTALRDPQGNVSSSQYDPAGRLITATAPVSGTTQYQYDAVGNTTAITQADTSSGAPLQVETRQYDALNRVLTDTVSGPGLSAPLTTLTRYDHDGNVFQVQQPSGDTRVSTYDLADQLSGTLLFTAPISQKGQATIPAYDTYSYDNAGNEVTSTDADGRSSTTQYDGDNRPVQSVDVTSAPTGTTTITTTPRYDPNGNVVQQTTQTSDTTQPGVMQTHTTAATYNAADWLLSTTDAGPSALLLTQYGYDAAGQQRTQTMVDGVTRVTTALDAQGRATAIGEALGGVGPYTSTFGYTANDLPLTATLPNGVQQSAQYDPNSRLTNLSTTGANGLSPSSYRYGYNAADWTTSATGISGTDTLTHDAQGRLTAESGPSVLASLPGQTYRWNYDGNGNILTGIDDFGSVYTNTYSLSSPNHLVQSFDPSSHSSPTNTTYFRYDRHGDTTAITTSGAVTSSEAISTGITYDAQERPLTLTHKDASYSTQAGAVFDTISVQYNAQGLRSRYTVVVSGTAILDQRFSYRDDGEVGQVAAMTATLNSNGSIKSSGSYTDTFVYGPVGEPLEFLRQQNGQTTRYWYVLDGRNNVVAVTDSTGKVVDNYAYDNWGEMLPGLTMQQVPQQLRYGSYWQDDALGWYWINVRYYDPEVMRWMQPDPSEIDGAHTYTYVGDDPIDFTDQSGFEFPTCGYAIATTFIGCPSSGEAFGAVYKFFIGDDIHTLRSPCSGPSCVTAKAWAAVDLVLLGLPASKILKLGELAVRAAGPVAKLVRTATYAAVHVHVPQVVIDKSVQLLVKSRRLLGFGVKTIRVYRVEGVINERLLIGPNGEVDIIGKTEALFLNFGNRARAESFLERRIRQGLEGAAIKSFEVPQTYLDELRNIAVTEDKVAANPGAPLHVDIKFPDQYGLRAAQIEELIQAIIQGTGAIG